MAIQFLKPKLTDYLNKQASKWQDGVCWRWPDAAYTLVHKLAYLEREHYLMGRYSWSGVMHDWEKVFLYFTPWMTEAKVTNYHRNHSPHHVECPKRCLVEHMIQSYIDWDCAPLTKPDKPLTAYATLLYWYPDEIEYMLPVCLVMNPKENLRQLLDIHKNKSRTYVFKAEVYNRLIYQRVKKTLWKIVHNLPKDYDDIKRWYYPKDFHAMLPNAIFLKALLIIAKSRGQKINGEAVKDILTVKLIDLDHYQQFESLDKPLKQEHSWFALSDNPFFE